MIETKSRAVLAAQNSSVGAATPSGARPPAKMFPTRFQIQLSSSERIGMETLFEADPHLVDELELIHKVLAAGIEAMSRDAVAWRADPDHRSRTEVEAAKRAVAGRVENYVGLPLDPLQQEAIEDFMDAHPHLEDEDALSVLLDLGLRAAQEEQMVLDAPKTPAAIKAEERVRLAERLHRRAWARCRAMR